MGLYRKKPVIVSAELYKPGMEDGFCNEATHWVSDKKQLSTPYPFIQTLEGRMIIAEGDYIISGVKGERYPCKPDIFKMTYEEVK